MIYTIGHSKHPAERFIALLRQHDIGALADVRSTPFTLADGSRETHTDLMKPVKPDPQAAFPFGS
jgi:hypothetical protein